MADEIYHGRTLQLIGDFEDAFRTPKAVPEGIVLPVSSLTLARTPIRPDDDTLRNRLLADKRVEQDETPSGKATGKFYLNELGWWLKMLWGAPVTTGAGPYTHVYTLNLNQRPSALLEAAISTGATDRLSRFLGGTLGKLTLNPLEDDPKWEAELMFGREVLPRPTVPWVADPTEYSSSQTCRCSALVVDEIGANTLGAISGGNIVFDNDLGPERLADGESGYGCILLGAPSITGTLTALFQPGTLVEHAVDNLTKRLQWQITNAGGTHSLAIDIPGVEFDEPDMAIETSKGLVMQTNWRAHNKLDGNGDQVPPTITLINDVDGY